MRGDYAHKPSDKLSHGTKLTWLAQPGILFNDPYKVHYSTQVAYIAHLSSFSLHEIENLPRSARIGLYESLLEIAEIERVKLVKLFMKALGLIKDDDG